MRGGLALLVLASCLSLMPRAAADPAPKAAELAHLTLREMILEESLPLARRGYVFRTNWLDSYFRRQPWYRSTGFDVRALPAEEQKRRAAIADFRAGLTQDDLRRRERALQDRKRAARRNCPLSVAAAGTRLLVEDWNGLSIRDVPTGKEIRIVPNVRGLLARPTPALSGDGARVLSIEAEGNAGSKISAWDASTGKSLGAPLLRNWNDSIFYVLVSGGASVFVDNLSTPRSGELRALDGQRAPIPLPVDSLFGAAERIAVSADRRRVLALAGGRPWLWRWKSPGEPSGSPGAPVGFDERSDTTYDADLSPDGRWVAAASTTQIVLLDVDRPGHPKYLEGSFSFPKFVSFSPDGRLVMAGAPNHELSIWEVPSGNVVFSQKAAERSLDCAQQWAAFLPGGDEVATVDDGGGVKLLRFRTGAVRSLGPPGRIEDPEANEIEDALIHRALGNRPSGNLLDLLSFDKQPDVFDQPLAEDDLREHAKSYDLRELEALIYARRGRRFDSPRWRAFAEELPWYHADPKYDPARLTPVDRANLALLVKIERELAPRAPRGVPDQAGEVPRSAFPGCPSGTTREARTDQESGATTIGCVKAIAAGKIQHGPEWIWMPTGRLRTTHSYADGKEDGPSVVWYWSGVRKEEGEMAAGQRRGRWRTYHPNGQLADEVTYAGGQLQGTRRRFFEDGKPALEARYERGVPVGPWTAYYDNGQRAIAASFPMATSAPFMGSYPDGKPWPASAKIQTCERLIKCGSPLERMDVDALPPVIPESSCAAGKVPRASRKAILNAARTAWADEGDYRPGRCTDQIWLACAPDLDGEAGAEVLAQIDYRILIGGTESCRVKDSNDAWEMSGLVVMSPPGPGRAAWMSHGLVGYPRFNADNGGRETSVIGYVRLPNGEVALRTSLYYDPGDCGPGRDEQIVVLRGGKWLPVAKRTIQACSQPDEPEAWDVF